MKITNSTTLKDIQELFSKQFPGLKIEFYQKGHNSYEGSQKEQEIDSSVPVVELNPSVSMGEISLDDRQTVKTFESKMENQYGLHVQVFRKSDKLWLQTSTTDDWTLHVQNAKGLKSIQN